MSDVRSIIQSLKSSQKLETPYFRNEYFLSNIQPETDRTVRTASLCGPLNQNQTIQLKIEFKKYKNNNIFLKN